MKAFLLFVVTGVAFAQSWAPQQSGTMVPLRGICAVSATVDAIQKGVVLPGHLPDLARSLKPAVAIAQLHGDADLKANATIENVRLNANRLSVSKPVIGRYVSEGKVKVVGAVYDLATGKVNLL